MCTVIVRTGRPLALMGIRDEFADRPWEGPAEHWPDYPGVVGGRDLKAGGTWLAVDREARRAAALLNGRGTPAPADARVSRGDLALGAAATGELPAGDLTRYDPFHLVLADLSAARLLSWDGRRAQARDLPDGTSMIINTGLDPDHERTTTQLPRFDGDADWHEPLRDPPSDATDALIVRHELPDGRVFATLSVTLVTLAPEGVTYEFTDMTADQHG